MLGKKSVPWKIGDRSVGARGCCKPRYDSLTRTASGVGIERQLTVIRSGERLLNVLPDHPVRFQVLCTVPGIETPCHMIRGVHVNAHTTYILGEEPSRQTNEQFRCNTTTSVRGADRNPLQLSVTAEAARQ